MIYMRNFKEDMIKIFKFFLNPVAVGLIILAVAVFFLAASLTRFSIELSHIRREIPGILTTVDKQLDRVDKQLSAANKMLKGSENAGVDFSAGVNKGISSGIVDIPMNTVSNVGEKLKDTAVKTGTTSYGFWNGLKEKLMFWKTAAKTATKEAQGKPAAKK